MAVSDPILSDDWSVACSDEETSELTTENVIELCDRLNRNEILTLEWKCLGRRSPTPERPADDGKALKDTLSENVLEQRFFESVVKIVLMISPHLLS